MSNAPNPAPSMGRSRMVIPALLLVMGLGITYLIGQTLRTTSAQSWDVSIDTETQRLTSVLVQWFESSIAPLNAVGAVVYAQASLTETEFWDSVALLEDNEPDFFPSALLIASQLNGNWVVDFSISDRERLAQGAVLNEVASISQAINSASENSGLSVIGAFWDQGEQGVTAVAALSVETVLQERIILAVIDIPSLLDGLTRTQLPPGLGLSLSGQASGSETSVVIGEIPVLAGDVQESRTIRAQTAFADLTFDWRVTEGFSGGGKSPLADWVQIAGSLLSLLVTGIAFILIGQNQKISALVDRRTAELADREAELRLALDNMPGGMMLTDTDLTIRLLNGKFLDNVELDRDFLKPGDSLEKLVRELVSRGGYYRDEFATTDDEVTTRLQYAMSSDKGTFKHDTPSGRVIEVQRERTDAGGLVSVSIDATERVRAEDELKIFRRFAESSSNGLGIADIETKQIKYVNTALRELLEEEDLATVQTKGIPAYYTAEGQTKLMEEVFPALMRDGQWTGELSLVTAKNTKRTTLENYFVLPDERGNPRYFADVIIDITERRKAEAALSEAKQRLDLALEGSGFGLWDWNITTGDLFFDAQWARIAGYELHELEFRIETWQGLAHPEDMKRIRDENPVEQRSDETFEHEVRLKHKDGQWIWTLSRGKVVSRDDDGRPARIIGTVLDMSPRKSAEQELERAKNSAENALNELKLTQERLLKTEKMASLGQLTAGIAHEIKNPLNFVNNFSETSIELLEELSDDLIGVLEKAPEDTREDIEETVDLLKGDLNKIHSHGVRADGIVRSMLLHARGDEADRVVVSVNELMKEAFQLSYHGERARNKSFNVAVEEEYDENAGQFLVASQEITRVLVNIMSNAFYAMMEKKQSNPAGPYEPTIALSTCSLDERVRLKIRDNGTGMPEAVRQKLFDPFFTTKPTGSGTGLGLSISYDIIVQQHDGHMDVLSELGAYTEFVIELPRGQIAKNGEPAR